MPPASTSRTVRTRRVAFECPDTDLPRHYVSGDLVMSHVVSVLSALFPNGEDFFVRSVRHYRDRIAEPELRRQVGGFIGQEAIHGREHRRFNDRLSQLGYPTRRIDWGTGVLFKGLGGRILPPSVQLAVTAALEHYTATLAYVLMSNQRARDLLDVDEVRHLLLWHALEESEHKAVAFDVFQAAVGDQRMRVTVMNVTTALFLGAVVLDSTLSVLGDPAARDVRRLARSIRGLRRSPWSTPAVWRHLRDYNRRDFHPDDHDTTDLIAWRRAELFGEQGRLLERMSAASEEA